MAVAPAAEVLLPYEAGEWKGLKRFACPHCSFTGVKGSEQIVEHIQKGHPTKWLEE